jgi:hypothetical protein
MGENTRNIHTYHTILSMEINESISPNTTFHKETTHQQLPSEEPVTMKVNAYEKTIESCCSESKVFGSRVSTKEQIEFVTSLFESEVSKENDTRELVFINKKPYLVDFSKTVALVYRQGTSMRSLRSTTGTPDINAFKQSSKNPRWNNITKDLKYVTISGNEQAFLILIFKLYINSKGFELSKSQCPYKWLGYVIRRKIIAKEFTITSGGKESILKKWDGYKDLFYESFVKEEISLSIEKD